MTQPETTTTARQQIGAEVEAMRDVGIALADLDETTRARVLRWATDRFTTRPGPTMRDATAGGAAVRGSATGANPLHP